MSEDYINLDSTIEEYEKLVVLKESIIADIEKSTQVEKKYVDIRKDDVKMIRISIDAMKEKKKKDQLLAVYKIAVESLNDRGNYVGSQMFKNKIRTLKECEVK